MWLYTDIKSLGDIPRYHAKTQPDHTALIGAGRRVSYQALNDTASQIAHLLQQQGVPVGAHVGFLGKNSIEYFEVLFGTSKAGCALLPLNWRLSPVELQSIINDAELELVFVDREYRDLLDQLCQSSQKKFQMVEFDSTTTAPTPLREQLDRLPTTDLQRPIEPNATALLMYTSGTTGKPKGVQITHDGLNHLRLCEHLEPAYQWQPNDIMMFVMPNFHLVGTGLSIQGLYNGVTLSILPTADMAQLLATIQRDRPTICCLVPTAIQMLLDHPDAAKTDFSSLRLVMYAGSAIGMKLLKRALAEMKCQFMQFYGSTEAAGQSTLLRPEQHDLTDETKLKSCGTPLPLMEIRIVDESNQPVPDGSIGEFQLRSPSMFKGYWKQPETTAAAMCDGWYRSGDAGYRDADGLYYIVDRVKDMIISGGENIYSTEVEQALLRHPQVSQVAVIGLPDEHWGERVTAVVVPTAQHSVTPEELVAHCRTLIAGYKVPKTILFRDALPMTPSGKVLKTALRTQCAPTTPSEPR
ncbi:MAG TPA: long-chain-fatty-acid--CoA ligase [Macromonas sp.]|nr:long-chain-fatty-acid--CoA ligase [Macromonas sp.]